MINILKRVYKNLGIVILKKQLLIFINRLKRGRVERDLPIKTFSIKKKHVFFGYYDVNPISSNNQKILSIVVPKRRSTKEEAKVGYFDINSNNEFHQVGATDTWCWQQGSRLRWSNENSDVIIYNNLYKNKYGCAFQNIKTKEVLKQLSHPIYDISKDEKYGLSLNFSRLQRLRAGYGYDNIFDTTVNEKASESDGVFLIDIETDVSKLIISLKKISEIKPHPSMNGANHYINHLSWNKSASRFLFFHLWTNGKTRSSRLLTADKDGKNIYLLENSETVSHYDWKDDDFICMTTHSRKHGTRYSIYKDLTNERDILDSKDLRNDGHPTYHPIDKNLFLSDTYPDKYGERKLFAFNIKKKEMMPLGSYKSPLKYRNDYRCDLHPRWNNDGHIISFDSTHTNQRTINIIDFEDTLHT